MTKDIFNGSKGDSIVFNFCIDEKFRYIVIKLEMDEYSQLEFSTDHNLITMEINFISTDVMPHPIGTSSTCSRTKRN